MAIIPGSIILSSPEMEDEYFSSSAILLATVGAEGTVGFILNKVFYKNLGDLSEFSDIPNISLYEGGPMDQEHLFFIHRHPDLLGGTMIHEGVYFGGDFHRAVRYFQQGKLVSNDFKVFIGYCGWDAGQLDAEIAAGDWQMMMTNQKILFSETENIWQNLLQQHSN